MRVSYVPNDRRAVQKQHRRNRSDLQLHSIQQQQQQRQDSGRQHHQYQQQRHMIPDQRGQHQPQSLPPAGSGVGQTRQLNTSVGAAGDKDKCIIS